MPPTWAHGRVDGRRAFDLANPVSRLHGADRKGRVLHRARVGRTGLMAAIAEDASEPKRGDREYVRPGAA